MSSISKVIVVQGDRRASDAVRLGFEREGATVVAADGPEAAARLIDPDTGLVVAGPAGTEPARSLLTGLVRACRRGGSEDIDAPLLWLGNGVTREEAWAAGADEVLPQPAYVRDVVTIGKLIGGRRHGQRSQVSGDLGDYFGVFYLVRALAATGRSGVLTLVRGLRRGELRLFEGEVTSAHMGGLHGQAGLHQLLLWSEARFEWRHEPVVRRRQIPLEHAEVFDQAERFLADVRDAGGGLSPSAVYEQDVQRIGAMGKRLPTEVHGVLRLFDANRTIADVLEDSPFRVFETLRVALRAVEVGLLRRVQTARPKAAARAVLAVEEWLVGNDKDAVIDRTMTIGQSEPVAAAATGGKRHKRKKTKRDRDRAPRAAQAAPEVDWAALVPRASHVDMSSITGVVPAASLSGEIVIAELEGGAMQARREGREGLEALTDPEARRQMFPVEVNLEEPVPVPVPVPVPASPPPSEPDPTEPVVRAEPEPAAAAPAAEPAPASATVAEAASETVAEAASETVAEAETEAATETEAETVAEAAPAAATEAAPVSAPDPEPAPAPATPSEPPAVIAGETVAAPAPEPPPADEPSILVADLAAAHAAIAAVAPAQAAAPAARAPAEPADAHDPATSAEIAAVRHDATSLAAAFSDDEEAFFRAGVEQQKTRPPPVESFADLDDGYQPQGFWDRLLGKRDKKPGPK